MPPSEEPTIIVDADNSSGSLTSSPVISIEPSTRSSHSSDSSKDTCSRRLEQLKVLTQSNREVIARVASWLTSSLSQTLISMKHDKNAGKTTKERRGDEMLEALGVPRSVSDRVGLLVEANAANSAMLKDLLTTVKDLSMAIQGLEQKMNYLIIKIIKMEQGNNVYLY